MRTNISNFKNLKRSDFKNLLDFTDKNFKGAYKELIEIKINDKTDVSKLKEKLNKLRLLESFYLLNLCLPLKEYENIDFLISLFFTDEYENFGDEMSFDFKLKFDLLKKEILRESRQKNPLFKKEIVFKMFISENLKNIEALHRVLLNIQLLGKKLKKEYKLLYELYIHINKAINAKVPNFEINIEKFKIKYKEEVELEIFNRFWEKTFPQLYENKCNEKGLSLILVQVIFRDYLFNKRDTLVIDVIATNNYIKEFRELDEINKNWKHEICLYLYELCEMDFIRTKSKDDVIYFLSVIFNSFSGFSFSSIELRILNYRYDYEKTWENFIKNHIKVL
ncbi:hypothetical protein SAMN05421786_10588 [Chryseobacterium ureilyticum]|uniref:Uncharacterized protein n=1 Tax=Chryseobacterium ureilyticum TaxID=373668 RepID=A0A1N7PDX9_9FLAO|nr:hypothetical protein [Chryseobacterium ureilyticum]SIT08746.1 hypothetical protein SAMN05421786_10588 [Chryseobacterium ureilyticum]